MHIAQKSAKEHILFLFIRQSVQPTSNSSDKWRMDKCNILLIGTVGPTFRLAMSMSQNDGIHVRRDHDVDVAATENVRPLTLATPCYSY